MDQPEQPKSSQPVLPWILAGLLGVYVMANQFGWLDGGELEKKVSELSNSLVVEEVRQLGRLELVKYTLKEVVELRKESNFYFDIFKLIPDSRALMIVSGEAVGCVDLLKIDDRSITQLNDTMMVKLPQPEVCYVKLRPEKTRFYSLNMGYFGNEAEFVEEAYGNAEKKLMEAALKSSLLQQTQTNAELVLRPLLEELTRKTVMLKWEKGEAILPDR